MKQNNNNREDNRKSLVTPVTLPGWAISPAEPSAPAVVEPEAATEPAADHQFIIAVGPEADRIWDAAEPPGEPCPQCGGLEWGENFKGDRHCPRCRPPHPKTKQLQRQAALLRRRSQCV